MTIEDIDIIDDVLSLGIDLADQQKEENKENKPIKLVKIENRANKPGFLR